MNASPLRTLVAFARCRRGGVAIIFALTFTPLFMMAGGALDYWKAIKIKASYQQAAESAALAGSRQAMALESMGDPKWQEQAVDYAKEFFNNNIKQDVGAAVTIDIKNNNGSFLTTVKFDGNIPSDLLKMFKLDKFHFSGAATSGITKKFGYIDLHIVVDNSVSMGVGATEADLEINEKTLPQNCEVACHYHPQYAADVARRAGAQLRIDILKNAMVNALNRLKPNWTPGNVQIAVYTMSNTLKKVFDLSPDIDAAIKAIGAVDLTGELGQGGTNSTVSLQDLADKLAVAGAGSAKTDRKGAVIVMTDGVQGDVKMTSYAGTDRWGKYTWPDAVKDSAFKEFNPQLHDGDWYVQGFDPSVCEGIKAKNYEMFTLNVKYVVPANTKEYRFVYIRDTLLPWISDNMQTCASGMGNAFTADQPVEFDTAVQEMFDKAVSFSKLTLTRDWSRKAPTPPLPPTPPPTTPPTPTPAPDAPKGTPTSTPSSGKD